MHPLVRGAAAAATLTALGSFDRSVLPPVPGAAPPAEVRGVDGLPAPCGPGTLPEGPVCVRIPGDVEALSRADVPASTTPAHTGLGSDRIPRRPERAADPAAYAYPVGEQRAPKMLGSVESSSQAGVHLAARPGEKVVLVALEHQEGPAEVVFVGDLIGSTVVTAHTVNEGARKRTYLLLHGSLDHAEAGVTPGARFEAGATLGFARLAAGGSLIDVYLEARQVREGVKLDAADPKRLIDASVAVPTDVRNVLPLR